MKKIIQFLPAMAILLASGLAVATTKKVNAHNVYWTGSSWQGLTLQPDQYECEGSGWCTAFKDEDENITDIRPGEFAELN